MPANTQAFFEAAEARRSYYKIKNESPVSDERIVEIVKRAVKDCPSAFNMQAGRAVVFFHEQSVKVWDTVAEHYLPTVADKATQEVQRGKIEGYKSGYGSVAIFEDQQTLKDWTSKMPFLGQAFATWSENSTGMLQYLVWTALEAEGLGASLQHHFSYHDKVGPAIAKHYDIPESWRCTAILPFGAIAGPPGQGTHEKTFLPVEDRVKVFH